MEKYKTENRDKMFKKFGAIYDPDTQIVELSGMDKKNLSGEQIILLVGYDQEKQLKGLSSIQQVLPIILYTPYFPNNGILPMNLSTEKIARLVKKHLKWNTMSRFTKERQFWNQYLSPERKHTNKKCIAKELLVPLSHHFFNSLAEAKFVVGDRVSLIYRRQGEQQQHLADLYCLKSVVTGNLNYRFSPHLEEVEGEFLTCVFIGDEDNCLYQPNKAAVKELLVPADSPAILAQFTLRLNQKNNKQIENITTTFRGKDIWSFDEIDLEDEVEYKGYDSTEFIPVLSRLQTLSYITEDGSGVKKQDYMVEVSNPATGKRIDLRPYTSLGSQSVPQIVADVTRKYNKNLDKDFHPASKNYKLRVVLPYFGCQIEKMFAVAGLDDKKRYLALDDADYLHI